MKSAKLRFLLVAFLLLSLVPANAGSDTWIEVRSKHFTVITDGGERNAHEVLKRFEQMRSAFQTLFQKMNVNTPVPLQIVAFKNTKELKQYGMMWKGKPVELAGFFQKGEDRNFIALDLSTEGWDVVFHEYAHLLLNNNLPPTPLWVDEGYADFFSSITVNGKEVEFGQVPRGHAEILQENSWMKTIDLFSVKHDSREYNESNNRRHVFYAQSWLAIHYMFTQKKLPQLAKYLNLVEKEHVPILQAMQQAFGMTPEQFDKTLNNYFRGRSVYYRAPAPPDAEGLPYTTRTMQPVEKGAELADLKFHSPDHRKEGVEEFKAIVAADPNNLVANRGLAYSFLQNRDFDGAAPFLKRASAAGSKDPRLHYFNAMLIGRSSGGMITADREHAEEMKAELEKAIELDPNYADAYNMMSFVASTLGDNDAALKHSRKAMQLNPRNEFYGINLSNYLLRAEKWDEAEELLKQLKDSSSPGVAQIAAQQLEQLQRMKEWKAQGGRVQGGLVVRATSEDDEADEPAPKPSGPAPKVGFLKGKLVRVDCSNKPEAMLDVKVGPKLWHLRTRDTDKLILIGADSFSCQWTDKAVAVNYVELGDGAGAIISLEVE